jgi:PIN domain nuclease of toxin-antitoxin system
MILASTPAELPANVCMILGAGELIIASVVSYWELVLKKGCPTAPVLQPALWWDRYVTNYAGATGEWHRDPFDRMLAAQALAGSSKPLSSDAVRPTVGVPGGVELKMRLVVSRSHQLRK